MDAETPVSLKAKKAQSVKLSTSKNSKWKKEAVAYAFISPYLIGFLVFTLGPMIASLYLSFTDYDLLSSPKWVGLDNYIKMFTGDTRFWNSLKVTLNFAFISIPLKLAFALFVAVIFSKNFRGVGLYRSVYYVPSILGGSVAVAIMWKQLFGKEGALNGFLSYFGIEFRGSRAQIMHYTH